MNTVQRPGEGEGGAVQGEQEAADRAQVRLKPAHEAVPRHREHDHRQEQGDHQPGDWLQGKCNQFIFGIIFSLSEQKRSNNFRLTRIFALLEEFVLNLCSGKSYFLMKIFKVLLFSIFIAFSHDFFAYFSKCLISRCTTEIESHCVLLSLPTFYPLFSFVVQESPSAFCCLFL